MKIAGQKNDGAWFRANRFIRDLGQAGAAAFAEQLQADADVIAMWGVVDFFTTLAGYAEPPATTASVEAWTMNMASIGIPRQVWLGLLSWDTYIEDTNSGVLVPEHRAVWLNGSKAIRKIFKRFKLARRQTLDFANELGADQGNVGGIADADIET